MCTHEKKKEKLDGVNGIQSVFANIVPSLWPVVKCNAALLYRFYLEEEEEQALPLAFQRIFFFSQAPASDKKKIHVTKPCRCESKRVVCCYCQHAFFDVMLHCCTDSTLP